MEEIYVIIRASNCTLVSSRGFKNYGEAEEVLKALIDDACNPNAYYIQPIYLV